MLQFCFMKLSSLFITNSIQFLMLMIYIIHSPFFKYSLLTSSRGDNVLCIVISAIFHSNIPVVFLDFNLKAARNISHSICMYYSFCFYYSISKILLNFCVLLFSIYLFVEFNSVTSDFICASCLCVII